MDEYVKKSELIEEVGRQYGGCMNTFFAKPNDFVQIIEDAPATDVVKNFAERVVQTICDNTYPDFDKNGKPVNIWKAREGYKAIEELAKNLMEEVMT